MAYAGIPSKMCQIREGGMGCGRGRTAVTVSGSINHWVRKGERGVSYSYQPRKVSVDGWVRESRCNVQNASNKNLKSRNLFFFFKEGKMTL